MECCYGFILALEILLYIPTSVSPFDPWDVIFYNEKANPKGSGAVIMVQEENTTPEPLAGKFLYHQYHHHKLYVHNATKLYYSII